VLAALGGKLNWSESHRLAADLPPGIGGWVLGSVEPGLRFAPYSDFVSDLAVQLGVTVPDADRRIGAVLAAVRAAVAEDTYAELMGHLPASFRHRSGTAIARPRPAA
jgi:uncharacterized protein (DUF2267 family)